jgi:hypothetical protein
LSFRILAVTLGIIALVTVAFVSFTTKPAELMKTLVASVLSLWALRAIVAVDAPKTVSLMDYFVIGLIILETVFLGYQWLTQEKQDDAV